MSQPKIRELIDKKCQSCEQGTPPLSDLEVSRLKKLLTTNWKIIGGKKLRQEFTFNDFMSAMIFVNDVAAIAEDEGHHPDIYIYYKKVVLELTTHAIDNLTENDFILARKIEMCC